MTMMTTAQAFFWKQSDLILEVEVFQEMIHFNNYHHIAPGLEIDQTAIIETKVLQALGDGTVVSSIHLTPARRCYIISFLLLYFILLAFAVFYISCIW